MFLGAIVLVVPRTLAKVCGGFLLFNGCLSFLLAFCIGPYGDPRSATVTPGAGNVRIHSENTQVDGCNGVTRIEDPESGHEGAQSQEKYSSTNPFLDDKLNSDST